jgi:hypothetical protein
MSAVLNSLAESLTGWTHLAKARDWQTPPGQIAGLSPCDDLVGGRPRAYRSWYGTLLTTIPVRYSRAVFSRKMG